ncbi:MAG: hypothetical protein WBF25_20500 [Terriglobales bacterium]
MKPKHPYGAVAVWCVVFFGFATSMYAQQATAPTRAAHMGAPQDWSDRHIVFSRGALAQHPELIYREPRIFHQAMQRWRAPNSDVFHGAVPVTASVDKSGQRRDWNTSLGTGRVDANMFPGKYSFDPNAAPSCSGDFVVFGLATSGADANLIAFNNLYVNAGGTGLCAGLTAPTVLFAYNITTVTGGKIVTSPIFSEDGTKIAFVESVPGASPQAIFHVLTWGTGGTLTAPIVPIMASVPFSPSANDTRSSPWIDYSADTVYVGADNGSVYQITGVFNGTPTLSGSPWPVSAGATLVSSPVLDAGLGYLMVGSANGNLYQINTTGGAIAQLEVGDTGSTTPGIVGPPIVDVTNGWTFVVTANNSSNAALVEVKTTTMVAHTIAPIGEGSSGGTAVTLYEPAFSNDYYNDPTSGIVTVCGTGGAGGTARDTTPYQYTFGFSGLDDTMSESPSASLQLSTSTTDHCTAGWTEFFNPDISSGVEFFFFGLNGDCTLMGTSTATGCVVALSSDPTIPTASAAVTGGTSGILVDNYTSANIYFAARGVNTAYQFTQVGLN